MKHKPLLFLMYGLAISSIIISSNHTVIHADNLDVVYQNNAYQLAGLQDNLKNFFLGDSIYSRTPKSIHLKNSIKLKKTKSRVLYLYFSFDDNLDEFMYQGSIHINFLDSADRFYEAGSLNLDIQDEYDIENMELHPVYTFYPSGSSLVIKINLDAFPGDFTLMGDEHLSEGHFFCINVNASHPTRVTKFMMSADVDSVYSTKYYKPTLGNYSQYDSWYYDGSTYALDVDYDNRLTPQDIAKNIVAYDFGDNMELTKSIEEDNYTNAIKENELGEYTFKVVSTDSSDNTSTLLVKVNIVDKTAPIIIGDKNITISYTELNEDGTYDISSLFQGQDNYDGTLSLDKGLVHPIPFRNNDIVISSTDSSSNTGTSVLHLNVIDDVDPIIKGPNELTYYQFELNNVQDIINKFTFDDGKGSGIVEKGIVEKDIESYFMKSGTFPITLYCKDAYGNKTTFETSLNIKDGLGPVFFINEVSLSTTTSSYKSADDLITLAMNSNLISPSNYESVEFIDNNYSSNYDIPGDYDTKVVCYKKDGTRDYIRINVHVEGQKKNVFDKFIDALSSFFESIGSFFKYIWSIMFKR